MLSISLRFHCLSPDCNQTLKNEKNYKLMALSNDSGTSLWPLVLGGAQTSAVTLLRWNLDITKGQLQGTGKICSLLRGLVISRFFFIYFTIAGVKKIVRYTEDFVISRFHCILIHLSKISRNLCSVFWQFHGHRRRKLYHALLGPGRQGETSI